MKVRSINNPNEMVTWNVTASSYPVKSQTACRSKRQFEIGRIICTRFKIDPILEDVSLPNSRLSLDFYLPQRKLAIEVQGEQHNEFNPFFHEDISDFNAQKDRDAQKLQFCELNGITLLTFETVEEAKEYFNL